MHATPHQVISVRAHVDRMLYAVAVAAARVWFRDVEIVGRDRLPRRGPVLVVASHFNGLLDPVLVAITAGRVPRFLAAASLWRNPLLGRLLDLAGALPVHRASEGRTERNVGLFTTTHRALAEGAWVALFPEGTTHDEPRVLPVRTGAARIALGARAAGARGLQILPIGLVYTSKATPRTRALVRVSEPVDLDRDLEAFVRPGESDGPGNTAAVRRLTDEIRARLVDAALDYERADVALAAAHAVAVALRPAGAPVDWEPSLHEVERCTRVVTAAPRATQQEVVRAFIAYHDALTLLGATDAHLVAGDLTEASLRRHVAGLAAVTAAVPIAATGVIVNGPAAGLVWAAGRLPLKPAMRGTARLLTGLAAFPLSWLVLRWWAGRRGWRRSTLATLAAGPGGGLVALSAIERLRALRSAEHSLTQLRRHAGTLPGLRAEREAVVAAVASALRPRFDELEGRAPP
jgi:glycerol-3-phosphate O-acyltransferase / dihydroxyacetone phosphate acyltransferase